MGIAVEITMIGTAGIIMVNIGIITMSIGITAENIRSIMKNRVVIVNRSKESTL